MPNVGNSTNRADLVLVGVYWVSDQSYGQLIYVNHFPLELKKSSHSISLLPPMETLTLTLIIPFSLSLSPKLSLSPSQSLSSSRVLLHAIYLFLMISLPSQSLSLSLCCQSLTTLQQCRHYHYHTLTTLLLPHLLDLNFLAVQELNYFKPTFVFSKHSWYVLFNHNISIKQKKSHLLWLDIS